jgi:AcrR family transcriptional regulator
MVIDHGQYFFVGVCMSRQAQKQATAQRIFEAALDLFMQQGYAATTVEQITKAAGVAKGTFFTHFASKEAILEHIGQIQMNRLRDTFAADPHLVTRSVHEQLHTVLQVMVSTIANQPVAMQQLTVELLTRQSLFTVDTQGIAALDQFLTQIVRNGQERGELRTDTPPERIALLVRSVYFLAFFEWIQHDNADLAQLVDHYFQLALMGIRAPATPTEER